MGGRPNSRYVVKDDTGAGTCGGTCGEHPGREGAGDALRRARYKRGEQGQSRVLSLSRAHRAIGRPARDEAVRRVCHQGDGGSEETSDAFVDQTKDSTAPSGSVA